jgi:hypothetical protein
MRKYSITLKLGDLGTLQYENENEEEFASKISNVFELREKAMSILSQGESHAQIKQYPSIPNPQSYPDAIEKALSTSFGQEPRTLHEIHTFLADHAIHITKQALGSLLYKMVRANRLSRVRRNGVYAYILPLQRRPH